MTVTANDIAYVLSGGLDNDNPELSLGGDPSGYPVVDGINNIFPNISIEEANQGLVDFRCFYVFNNNTSSSLYEIEVYITNQTVSGSNITIGILKITDRQKIYFNGTPTDGSFTAAYENIEFVVNYDSESNVFAENIKNGLESTGLLSGIVISVVENPLQFIVRFEGADNFRRHPLITIIANNLVDAQVFISKISDGGPINSVAPLLSNGNTPPGNVTFLGTTNVDPIILGTLKAGEGFPIWIKRDTPRRASAVENDGFLLTVKGKPI